MKKRLNALMLSALMSCLVLAPAALGQQSEGISGDRTVGTTAGQVMVGRMIQDEIQDLPSDHSALFSASREISIDLDVPSTGDLAGLENALVTVIRPSGEITELRPGIDGLVRVERVEEGPHAFVVASEQAHGAKLFYLEEAPEEAVRTVAPPRMTLLEIAGEQLQPFLDEIGDVNGPLADLKPTVQVGPEFGYRVALEEDGSLRGTLLPIADSTGGARLKGTRIAVFFRGIQIAETECDEDGQFVVRGMRPGIHGVIAAGPEGYAAFALEVVSSDTEVARNGNTERFVTRMAPPALKVPVILIPPPMIPAVREAIERYYGLNESVPLAGDALGLPMGGFMSAPYGGGFGGGGGGGGGGVEALAALAGLGAIAAGSNEDNSVIVPPETASPVIPGLPAFGN